MKLSHSPLDAILVGRILDQYVVIRGKATQHYANGTEENGKRASIGLQKMRNEEKCRSSTSAPSAGSRD